MFALANPKRFMDASSAFLPWLAGAAVLALGAGVILGLLSPPDYPQSDTVKTMFLHVPAAWTAMMSYGPLALASLVALVLRHPLPDAAATACLPCERNRLPLPLHGGKGAGGIGVGPGSLQPP